MYYRHVHFRRQQYRQRYPEISTYPTEYGKITIILSVGIITHDYCRPKMFQLTLHILQYYH